MSFRPVGIFAIRTPYRGPVGIHAVRVPPPHVPTPSVPTPSVPTPPVPTPSVPTPSVPTPPVPTPPVPTPSVPTPPVPTPSVQTPSFFPEEKAVSIKLEQWKVKPVSSISSTVSRANESTFQNVHSYERSLPKQLKIPSYNPELKRRILALVQPYLSPTASKMAQELFRHSSANFDPVTGYTADDLFVYLLIEGQGEDLLVLLDEQLSDTYRLGQCAQGRTIRLYSLVQAFCS